MESEHSPGITRCWSQQEVSELIREIVVDLAPSKGELTSQTRLVEDLGYHSLSLLELAFSLEDEFDLPTIDEPTAREILTVGNVEQHVFKSLKSSGQLS